MRHVLAIDGQADNTRVIQRDEDATQVLAAAPGSLMMAKWKRYGRTASGKPISDDIVEQLADKAEAGYRSAPPPARVESVRLDPEDHETTSSVIRKALRKYLQVGSD